MAEEKITEEQWQTIKEQAIELAKAKREVERERGEYRETLKGLAQNEIMALRVMLGQINELEKEGRITRGEWGEATDNIQKLDTIVRRNLKRLGGKEKMNTKELDRAGDLLDKISAILNSYFEDLEKSNIEEVPTPEGKRRLYLKFGEQERGEEDKETELHSLYFEAADTLSKKTTPRVIKTPRKLAETLAISLKTPAEVEQLATEEQKSYNLVAGLTEGLAGGDAYLKKFIYCLAIILCKQSQQYGDKELGGINKVLRDNFNKTMRLADDTTDLEAEGKEEALPLYPTISIRYRDVANFMGIEVQGGRDLRQIQSYIDELNNARILRRSKDKKTGRDVLVGKTLFMKGDVLLNPKTEQEEGCILVLGNIFSERVKESYITFRSDLNKKLGRKKVKDITMNLCSLLLLGDRTKPYTIGKKTLLSKIGGDRPCYKNRNKKLEEEFREAIEQIKEIGLIKEVKLRSTTGGDEKLCFIYNENYLEDTLLAAPK